MTKFNNQELISNYPNCTYINPKLNSNKRIVGPQFGMHPTEAEGQKPVSGIMQLVKMQKGIVVKGITQISITQKGMTCYAFPHYAYMRYAFPPGLEIATNTVANTTSFFSLATKNVV